MKAIIETFEMKRIIRATKSFISKNDERPQLQWIRLDFDKETNKMKASALDGFMLSIEFAPLLQIDESFSAYIKPYLPVGAKADYIEISLENEFCNIVVGDRSVGYKQPQIKWLDTDKIVSDLETKEVVSKIFIDNEKLASALKSIDIRCMNNPCIIEYRGENTPILLKFEDSVRILQVMRNK
jgi:DNA polymerase III sliding clamp (beta) subunit (PCNA family)